MVLFEPQGEALTRYDSTAFVAGLTRGFRDMIRCAVLCCLLFCSWAVEGVSPSVALAQAAGGQPHSSMKGPFPDGPSVTRACLECHKGEGEEILHSAHWLWTGPSPYTLGHETENDLGKKNLINNF